MQSDSALLISIIVPVYNAEQYLECCLSSIQQQSYPAIEVILIDDGSTDGSNEICRNYEATDSRFHLYTQKNQGRAATRNKGLSLVTGTLVGFVDSDDWIEKDMFEFLYNSLMNYNADIVQCSYYYHKGEKIEDLSLGEKEHFLNREESLELLFKDQEIKNFLCNKLFRKYLFDGVALEVGKDFEDVALMYRLFAKTKKVVCLPVAKYHYIISSTSISHASFSVKAKFDYLDALNAQYCFAQSLGIWRKSSVVLSKKYLSIMDDFLRYNVEPSAVALLTKYLRENIDGWLLLRYAPYRAFKRFLFLYFKRIYTFFVRKDLL